MLVIVVSNNNRWLFYGRVENFDEAFKEAEGADEYDSAYGMRAYVISETEELSAEKEAADDTEEMNEE